MIALFKRKFILVFLIVLLCIVVLGLSYLFILNSQPFRNYLKPIIVKQLENNLGKNVKLEEIKSISFNSLIVSDLIISENTITDKNIVLLEAEKVSLNFRFILPFPQFKNWQLEISQFTLQKANLYLQRDAQGNFNIVKDLNFQPETIKNNFTFNKIYFKDSALLFQDDSVDQIGGLTTRLKKVNGFFDLNNFPEIEFEFNGLLEEESSLLAIQGYLFTDQPGYVINFQLKNADIMHFQNYISGFDELNLEKGQFDLNLALTSDQSLESDKISLQGEASFQEVNLKPQFLNNLSLENVNGLIKFKESEVQISNFQGLLHNQPFSLKGAISFQEIVDFNLDIKANNLTLAALKDGLEEYIPETSFSLQGDISLDVNLKGNFNDFQIKGKLNSSFFKVNDWQLQDLNLLFSFNEEQLVVESLEIKLEDAKIISEGTIDWRKPSPIYQFQVKSEELNLENSAFRTISLPDSFSGILSGNFIINGTLEENAPVNLTGNLTAQKIRWQENALPEPITAQLEAKIINSSIFEFSKLTLAYLHNQLNLYGKLDSKNQLDFQFSSNQISLEDFSFLFNLNELRGIGNISGKIQGTLSQPQIESKLELNSINLENLAFDDFKGEISYQHPLLQLKNITLNNNNISLTATGQVDLQKESQKQIDLELRLTKLNMNYLTELLNLEESFSGWTYGVADIQGNWPGISLDSQLNLEEISIRNYYLGKGNLIFSLAPDKISSENITLLEKSNFLDWIKNNYQLTIKELSFKQPELQINAQGKAVFGKDLPFSLDIDFNHKNLNQLVDLADLKDPGIINILPSKIEGKLKINGDLTSQQFLLTSQFSTLQDENDLRHDLKLTAEKKGNKIILSELLLKQEKGQFSAKGWLDFNQNLDIEFEATEFDLSSLAQIIEFKEEIKGNLKFIGTLTGSFKHPNLSIFAQMQNGNFRNFEFENLQSRLNWKAGTLEIQELTISYQKGYQVTAQGSIPFPFIISEKKEDQAQTLNQLPLNFKISLENIDLSFLNIFWNENLKQAQGNTNLILNLSGTVSQPILNGYLTLNQGNLELNSIPVKFDEIETRLEINNNFIKIPQMKFMMNNNLIYVSGDFKLVNFKPDDLRIKIRNEGGKLIYRDILIAQTNFLAEIRGSIESPQITGEFIFSEGELNWKPNYQIIPEKNDFSVPIKGKVDVSVKISENFQFKAPNLDLKLDGEIKIQGNLPQPIFTGQLSVRKGYFVFLEQKFQFSEGKLLLNEFTGTDVLLDIKANTKVSQVTVFLKISGNLSAPQISLSSTPALSEAEIISLLTLNKNIIGLSEGEIGELLKEEIFNLVFQGLSANFLRKAENQIANYLGLDFFRIEALLKEDTNITPFYDLNFKSLGIEVGKNISEELFLTYSTTLDGISERSFGIDYQFKSDLSFNAELNTFELEKSGTEIRMGLKFGF